MLSAYLKWFCVQVLLMGILIFDEHQNEHQNGNTQNYCIAHLIIVETV